MRHLQGSHHALRGLQTRGRTHDAPAGCERLPASSETQELPHQPRTGHQMTKEEAKYAVLRLSRTASRGGGVRMDSRYVLPRNLHRPRDHTSANRKRGGKP